ncbi:MAG: hypothetical protein GX173_06165 [Ruminococcaceae bacterium]|jgi:hypothetical protein|nr:hypothetical protein [Oscillospiraceae bacterium]
MKQEKQFRTWTSRQASIRYIGLLAAVFMLIAGMLRGEARLLLQRAVQICLGCIGIG